MQNLRIVTLHLHISTFRRKETMTWLFAAAQFRLLRPQQSDADIVGEDEDVAVLAAAAGVLLLGQVQKAYFSAAPSMLKSCFIGCYARDFPVAM
jgi:hypothetical protein